MVEIVVSSPQEMSGSRSPSHSSRWWYVFYLQMQASRVIEEILARVGLEEHPRMHDGALAWFKCLFERERARSRGRNVDVLSLVAVYLACKDLEIPLPWHSLLALWGITEPKHRIANQVLLRASSVSMDGRVPPLQQVLARVGQLASAAGLSPGVTNAAGRLLQLHLGSFESSIYTARVAALVVAGAACVGEKCSVQLIASLAGASEAAVHRCLRKTFPTGKDGGSGNERIRELRKRITATFNTREESPRLN